MRFGLSVWSVCFNHLRNHQRKGNKKRGKQSPGVSPQSPGRPFLRSHPSKCSQYKHKISIFLYGIYRHQNSQTTTYCGLRFHNEIMNCGSGGGGGGGRGYRVTDLPLKPSARPPFPPLPSPSPIAEKSLTY